jgi:hypothetical protein
MSSWLHFANTGSDMTQSILRKWREQGQFIRFVDGNVRNSAVTNLEFVSLRQAMQHVHEWKVDWDMELTEEERALVLTPAWRANLVFG